MKEAAIMIMFRLHKFSQLIMDSTMFSMATVRESPFS